MNNVRKWLVENKEPDTCAIVLVGSRAKNTHAKTSDVDIIIVKENYSINPHNLEIEFEDYNLDIWIRGLEDMRTTLGSDVSDANQLLASSLVISLLQEAKVWYEREESITSLIKLAKTWQWKPGTEQVLDFAMATPVSDWARNAFNEDCLLLRLARIKIASNQPVSNRRKDYTKLLIPIDRQQTLRSYHAMQKAYAQLDVKREWTEFKDATKAIKDKNYAKAFASIKDVIRFVVRCQLSDPPDQLLDPMLWKMAENTELSKETIRALKVTFAK